MRNLNPDRLTEANFSLDDSLYGAGGAVELRGSCPFFEMEIELEDLVVSVGVPFAWPSAVQAITGIKHIKVAKIKVLRVSIPDCRNEVVSASAWRV